MISLGIDIGGTGSKCVAFDENGSQKAISYVEYPLEAGMVNLPQEMLTESIKKVISDCVKTLPDPDEVAAITVSSFGESFAAIDKEGNSLGDIILYFANAENDEFDELVKKVGEEKFMRIARILPDASYSLAKMLYTKKTAEKPVWKFLFVAGFICYQLSGNPVCDVSLACRSLLYDVEKQDWSDELLEASGISRDELPTVLPTGGIAGNILPELAEKIGISPDVKIVIGSHDQIVNALGVGVSKVGEAVDVSGTCECIEPVYASIPESLDFQKYNFACVPYFTTGGYVTYAYNISAGSVVRWYRDFFGDMLKKEASDKGMSAYDYFNEVCADKPTDIIALPFLQGMGGTPDVNPYATGAFFGITTATRVGDIYRAILEGVTYEMRYNQEKLAENNVRFEKLYACGGGAKSAKWLQIKADILGCDIIPTGSDETGAMGSAILGLAAVTGRDKFEMAKQFAGYRETVHPIPDNAAIYDKKYEQYKKLRKVYVEAVL
ncbi:MAG: FGGY-family carbohydrate kinase [Lachnospiraceae bacterium]|nr:FGGY-family carbohydrate kinase [Lachnospiraceae bacterium]